MRREGEEFQSLEPYDPSAPAGGGRDRGRSSARVEAASHEPRPRDLGEILDLALDVFRARFAVLVGVSMLLWAPVRLAQPFIGLHRWLAPGSQDLPLGALFAFLFSLLATSAVSVLVNALASLFAAAHLEDRPLTVRAAFLGVLSRSFAVVLIAFVTAILTVAGTLCACIPGVLLAWKLYLAPPVCIIEGAGVGESLSRSFDLCRGRFLPWLGLVTVGACLTAPLSSVGTIADDPTLRSFFLDGLGMSTTTFDWIAVAFTSLFMGVASAFHGVVVAVWYFDCRARREGVDLAARLERLRGRSPVAAGAAGAVA